MKRLVCLAVAVCLVLVSVGPGPARPADAAGAPGEDWAARVQHLFDRSRVPGLVAVVVHGDDIVFSGGRGIDSAGAPMGPDTTVAIASVTKSFTATATVELARSAGLDLDAPVHAWLPEFTMADERHRAITIRQLLTHTSGLTDGGVGYYDTVNAGAAVPAEHVAALSPGRLSAPPGTRFAYANINYVLLGRLLEVRSGRPIAEHLQRELLRPRGLTQTVLDHAAPRDGFSSVFGHWLPRADTSQAMRADPAGGIATTATDLGRWLIASNGRGPTPLPDPVRATLETTAPVAPDAGAGWFTDDRPGWWGHGGNRYTYSAYALRNPATGWGVAVVVNGATMTDPTYDMAQHLAALTDGTAPPPVPNAVGTDRWALGVALGALAGSGILIARAGRWASRRAGQPARRILGLAWPAAMVGLVGATPQWAGRLVGGLPLTWPMLTYYSLTPLLTVLIVGAGAGGVLASRLWALRREATR